ncbi:hypothetical protein D4764_0157010 [Takifugu flavidus]|uniref:Uncharacterized protein n=1 Tax=Takifugu flavidus TaxID=433684 RepID=A0A5C6MIN0_9TELE|nr:hypothetical protein D4764_0157010 [Takifugu flavidus]
MEDQDQQSMSAGKEKRMYQAHLRVMVKEAKQFNPFVLRPTQEGGQVDGWLAVQRSMIEDDSLHSRRPPTHGGGPVTRSRVEEAVGGQYPLVASQGGAAPWIAAFKALTMGVPLALGDVRMVVAACVGLQKLAGVEQLAGTSVQGGNRAPDTTPFADHIGAFCDALRLHFPISVAAIEDFSHRWKDDGSVSPETWLHEARQKWVQMTGEPQLIILPRW